MEEEGVSNAPSHGPLAPCPLHHRSYVVKSRNVVAGLESIRVDWKGLSSVLNTCKHPPTRPQTHHKELPCSPQRRDERRWTGWVSCPVLPCVALPVLPGYQSCAQIAQYPPRPCPALSPSPFPPTQPSALPSRSTPSLPACPAQGRPACLAATSFFRGLGDGGWETGNSQIRTPHLLPALTRTGWVGGAFRGDGVMG